MGDEMTGTKPLPRWLDGDDAALEEWLGERPMEEVLARFDLPARRVRKRYRAGATPKKRGREGGP
ncbi:MAG TPA: hypothetical protein VJ397_09185 [Thermoplasmata archaeon]|nr:hypothetical protein [Thermoplasmata archaeon]